MHFSRWIGVSTAATSEDEEGEDHVPPGNELHPTRETHRPGVDVGERREQGMSQ